jgi:CO dehydrogenase maturation factor
MGPAMSRMWLIWVVGLAAYLVGVMQRTSFGIAGLDAAARFDATPALLCGFVVLQLLVYASLQCPRNRPPGAPAPPRAATPREVLQSLRHAWREPGTRLGLWTHTGTQFSGTVFALCAAVFSRYLAAKGLAVLAVDAAADRRLSALLGAAPPCWTVAHLRADRPRAASSDVRRVAPGARPVLVLGSDGIGPVDGPPTGPSASGADGVRLVATDAHEALLDHLADGPGEYVVVDLAANGTAATRYDLTVLVAEQTRRAVGLYRLHAEHAAAEQAALRVLGNKTSDGGDAAWLTEQVGDALLGCVGHSAWVRAAERGTAGSVSGLEPGNTVALAAARSGLDACRPRTQQQGDPVSGHPAVVEPAYYSASRR